MPADAAAVPDKGEALPDHGEAPPAAPSIVGRDLFKIYKQGQSETVALRGASLEVRSGEFVSLMGPSGSGKSTLLAILAGLARPSAGTAVVEGQDLAGLDEAATARWRGQRVGVVFQRGNLVPFLTAAENVALVARRRLGRAGARRRAEELLEVMGLSERAHHRPGRLSGGEAQRAGIAVALANEPGLLLGDEVTGELDSETSAQVMGVLTGLQRDQGLTLFLVTHDPGVAAQADRRLEITDGVIRRP
jgi:putative ABC transport system ATP-binding protein